MKDLDPVVAVAVHGSLSLIGLTGNIFIVLVHFLSWLKTFEVNPCDLIINCICISNMFLQGTVLFTEVCYFMFTPFYAQDRVVKASVVIMTTLAFCSLWCSTCLCFYYCVKIVNVSGPFFHKLKAKLSKMVPWMLVLSIAFSCAAGIPSYWDLRREVPLLTSNFTGNRTLVLSFIFVSRCNCLFQLYSLFSGVAFTIISLTAGALIISLCKHMIKMKRDSKSSGTGKIDSHLSAAKTVSSLLFLYLIFFGALNFIFNETSAVGTLFFSLCFITVAFFPTVNSIILIMGNRKLMNVLKTFLGIESVAGNTEVSVTTS